ncbi:hypothetical protein [Acidianus bottle-shaped virus 2 strain ABV2]|uniref:Uncharacterized protein n=1 Tax=Acidianus bottle-shaped virus 2 strain ABV2 TaxID=1732173 RepID=A0A0N9PAW3_9VIRU|nr:hypothetical protein AVU01_gp14 [Acidianus bottle-shaped virus 2 strain ABV2]ALG96762.1 hypothetical protein [Acidianus bottle-shaped virus 2 strain ABV2]
MKDDCYEVYVELKKILDKAVDCLNDDDFQLLLITLIAKKVSQSDLPRRILNK